MGLDGDWALDRRGWRLESRLPVGRTPRFPRHLQPPGTSAGAAEAAEELHWGQGQGQGGEAQELDPVGTPPSSSSSASSSGPCASPALGRSLPQPATGWLVLLVALSGGKNTV